MARMTRKKWKYFMVGACLFVFFLLLGVFTGGALSPLPFLYLSSFQGKVIDADTKQPISGGAVLAVYYKSVPSVAGSLSSAIDAQETLTNDKGEFRIPSRLRWFSCRRGLTEARITIFKPEYGTFANHKQSEAVGENKSWPSPDKYIVYELPELKTTEERRSNLPSRPHIPYPKMKHFVRLINQERINLGLTPLAIPK